MSAPRDIKLASVHKPKNNKQHVHLKKQTLRIALNTARSAQREGDGRNRVTEPLERKHEAPSPINKHASPSGLPWSIEMVPLRHLKPAARNPRTHPKKQIAQIVESIRQFGYVDPALADENLNIIGGHARVEAAKRVGLRTIPVIILAGLSDPEKRALALADNKISEGGGWLRSDLALELNELAPLLAEAGLDIALTGFEPAEIDALMGDLVDPEQDPADKLPELSKEPVSLTGDLWQLDRHRLLCGDAKQATDLRKLMGTERAAMTFTDPPYNVRISSIQGRGKIRHREFAEASGEMSREEFTKFLSDCLSLAAEYTVNGSIHFVCMDWRHIGEMLAAGREIYSELKNICIWVKHNAGMGSLYRSQHEFIFVFKHGSESHRNNIQLGRYERNRTNVWNYRGANDLGRGTDEGNLLALHPTVKPVALVADAMRDCSRRGDIVLDPFMGSGTTILAAERVGRRGYGVEIDPLYVDAAVRRWQHFTRRDAILQGTCQTFDEVAEARSSKQSRRPK